MPVERAKPAEPKVRPVPTVAFKGEAHPFQLGVNGWIEAQHRFATDKGPPLKGPTPGEIVDQFVTPGDVEAVRALVAIGLTVPKSELVWSEAEAGDVINETGMEEVVRLIVLDLAWLMFPREMAQDEAQQAAGKTVGKEGAAGAKAKAPA